MLLSTLYIMWPIHLQGLRLLCPTIKKEMYLQENTLSHKMLLSTNYIIWPINLQGYRLLHPTVKEEMHLQENTFFDIGP